ncbi:MAG: sel1 repeat family protein [Roseibium sp.]|uniref:tetratricopeptide repeat protein n=1 Tax=Roseibium sp. TaxID=1936156 RepID=UPI00261A1B5A|nr:tetratricopeptide repeat protein [Roseibium sp.]MCV0424213.1 sel1 repeat family protein [Roseibium sp.]
MFICFHLSAAEAETPSRSLEASALSRLGELILDGRLLQYDPSQALVYFSKAAELGDRTARLRMAEMSLRGIGTKQDIESALQEIKTIAAEGSLSAHVSLGDIYALGYAGFIDLNASLAAYEKAADAGNITAALRLSEIYRYGLFGRKDPRRSYGYLARAKALGNSYALYLMGTGLVEGEFRQVGRPRSGLEMFREAEKRGVADATIALAMRRDNRAAQLLPRSKLLNKLAGMADNGNREAALRLFDYYLDPKNWGSRYLSARNIRMARARLEKIAGRIDPGELEYRELLLDILSAEKAAYASLYDRIDTIPPRSRPSLLRRTLRSNPNAFFYFVQMRLSETGFFRGRLDGLLKRRTISAIMNYCASLGVKTMCRRGPLSVQTTRLLIHAF